MTHKFSYDERGSEVKYVQEFNMYLSFIKFSFVSPMKRIFSREFKGWQEQIDNEVFWKK